MSWRVTISPQAREQMRELIIWWRDNRPAAAQQVPREIKRVLRVLAETPYTGAPYRSSTTPDMRRCRLHHTPYYLYYQVQVKEGAVNIAAAWSAQRGEGPPI